MSDRPFLGILLMIGFCLLAPLGDALAKLLGATIPLIQLLFTRFGVQTIVLIPLALATGRALRMSPRVFRLTVIRSVLHIIGIGAMFTSLRYLPLADAVAIAFVMPFIMLLLGRYVLGEEVGSRRIYACIVGFIGTLFVIQPSFAEVGLPALLPLVVAVDFALFMLVTRQVAKEADPISLQAVSGLVASVLLGLLFLVPGLSQLEPFALVSPDGRELTMLLAIGLLGTFAHLLMTWSLRFAPSATVAPIQYLEIPIATVVGFAIFGDWPNGLALIGIMITIAAGLYVLARERTLSRVAPPA
ncbi:EamA domain-containing membrane protein RarD [Litoreibacter ponti]|uniref:EamA domain-containing membrane protein RarD n=1 Tax=Litoreibacter ponti TaxID=1510457 RepID=A0A2T6BKZ1_9RHOB|nr:DMT family transporter [Litoreibacter ponti]PTX56738.1 EamA domain-containing membrane protein RarD [Litoreibacter ponti]